VDDNAKIGMLGIRIDWAGPSPTACRPVPVMKSPPPHEVSCDKIQIAKAVNATVISLADAPQGYKDFDKGAARKYVLDPHGLIPALN
jgi:glutathione-independent formaldehyde dehydrogenase